MSAAQATKVSGKSTKAAAKVETTVDEADRKRGKHPLVGNKDPLKYPFDIRKVNVTLPDGTVTEVETATPEAYDPKKHLPLASKDFKTKKAFHLYKRDFYRAAAEVADKKYREEGAMGGDAKTRQNAKKLMSFQNKMKDMATSLKGTGVDVGALLKTAGVADPDAFLKALGLTDAPAA